MSCVIQKKVVESYAMKITLSRKEKIDLEMRHKYTPNRQNADRIKSILLRSEGWSLGDIAQALRLHNDTVSRYVNEYLESGKLSFDYRGSEEKLRDEQSEELIAHLEGQLYVKASDVAVYVEERYGVNYSVAGMTEWMKRHEFSYKRVKGQPAKADREKQILFVEKYEELKDKTPKNEPILFTDAMHPTMETKLSWGWIRQGKEQVIPTTASRTRMNVVGTIELKTMKLVMQDYPTVNGASIVSFLEEVKKAYPKAPKIHIILDQSGYHRSDEVFKYAKSHQIELHFLPPYSPNLNPIERVWKVMNEWVRNNRFFKSPQEFRDRVTDFFQVTFPGIADSLRSRINDNFHIPEPVKLF